MLTISGRNYFNDEDFNKMCEALDSGEQIEVIIDCIGHTQNDIEQATYKYCLVEHYKEKLQIERSDKGFYFTYIYKII